MKTNSTPGPWFIMDEVGPQQEILISGYPFDSRNSDPLAHASATGNSEEERIANAALIRAAPEMAYLLVQISELFHQNQHNATIARLGKQIDSLLKEIGE